MPKCILELKAEFVYLPEWKREKINNFEITVIIFKAYKNVNLQFKKDFKTVELLTKTSFFLYFRDCTKNGEGNKGDVKSICARVTKHASKFVAKVEVNLNWLWTIAYGLFSLYI